MNEQDTAIEFDKGDVLIGSSKLANRAGKVSNKDAYYVANLRDNSAFDYYREKLGLDDAATVERMTELFWQYRDGWEQRPRDIYGDTKLMEAFRQSPYPPQCIDLEVAAICDLACPFCFRQFMVTPDKIIDTDVAYDIIAQAAALSVPSMKFNWRGEPLLHPRIGDFIRAAKSQGILETLINTNGTQLDEETGRTLIDAGLDVLILSFDGGTKESYEKMRPGRFKENEFENVVGNLTRFHQIREEMGNPFPYIKVQMIMTDETRHEIDQYHALFRDIADEVTVTQYTERGGSLNDLPDENREQLQAHFTEQGLPSDTPFMMTADGELFVSTDRVPCTQPLQRLMISYEGRVAMCCFDWGARHTVGFVSSYAYDGAEKDYAYVKAEIDGAKSGFEGLNAAEISAYTNQPEPEVKTLDQIWRGSDIAHVRNCQMDGRANDVEVCRNCSFKDTYDWKKI